MDVLMKSSLLIDPSRMEIETTKGGTLKKEMVEKLTDKYDYFR